MERVQRNLLTSLLGVVCALSVVSCGQNSGGGSSSDNQSGSAIVANVPSAQTCSQTTVGGSSWSQYRSIGITPYNWQSTNQNVPPAGFGSGSTYAYGQGCGANSFAACDAQSGMLCVPVTQQISTSNLAWFQGGQTGFQFRAYGHAYLPGGNRRNGRVRYNHIAQLCTLGLNNCYNGSQCLPINPQASVGVCAR